MLLFLFLAVATLSPYGPLYCWFVAGEEPPTTVVVTPTPTEIVPYKIPSGIIGMSWLIVIQEKYIQENTCYICHNYVHYLSLHVYQWSLS